VFAVVALPYFTNLGASSLWDSNEAFYAETPREMIESGKYLGGMSREERENLLMSEFVKLAIGKPSFIDKIP